MYILYLTHKKEQKQKKIMTDGKVLYKLMNDTIYRKQWKT